MAIDPTIEIKQQKSYVVVLKMQMKPIPSLASYIAMLLKANALLQTTTWINALVCVGLLSLIMSCSAINYLSARVSAHSMFNPVGPVQIKYVALFNTLSQPSKLPNYLGQPQPTHIIELGACDDLNSTS